MQNDIIKIVRGHITERHVDAIVNAANETLLGGGGVDGAIHNAAGPELLAECKRLGGCATGQAKVTQAFRLENAKHIIHTVGPVFGHADGRGAELLASCYDNSLRIAAEQGFRSIAFPSISTGVYGYPIESASQIALTTIRDFLLRNPGRLDLVEVVTFSDRDNDTYLRALDKLHGGA